jgi:hypothetical protein
MLQRAAVSTQRTAVHAGLQPGLVHPRHAVLKGAPYHALARRLIWPGTDDTGTSTVSKRSLVSDHGGVGGLQVITSTAEIDIANAGELRAALLAAAKRGDASVVVDMSGTAFCDSTGAECTGAGA